MPLAFRNLMNLANAAKRLFNRSTQQILVDSPVNDVTLPATGGRYIVKLSNGWLISTNHDSQSNNKVVFYKSEDDGATWSQLCYCNTYSSFHSTLHSYGTTVYLVYTTSGSVSFVTFDATTQTNVDLYNSKVTVFSNYNASGYPSLICDSSGNLYV